MLEEYFTTQPWSHEEDVRKIRRIDISGPNGSIMNSSMEFSDLATTSD
jgi:hypothetical protein